VAVPRLMLQLKYYKTLGFRVTWQYYSKGQSKIPKGLLPITPIHLPCTARQGLEIQPTRSLKGTSIQFPVEKEKKWSEALLRPLSFFIRLISKRKREANAFSYFVRQRQRVPLYLHRTHISICTRSTYVCKEHAGNALVPATSQRTYIRSYLLAQREVSFPNRIR